MQNSKLDIRLLRTDELTQAMPMMDAFHNETKAPDYLRVYSKVCAIRGDLKILGAFKADMLSGILGFSETVPGKEISGLFFFVPPELRNGIIGGRLFKKWLELCKGKTIKAAVDSERLLKMYKKQNFKMRGLLIAREV